MRPGRFSARVFRLYGMMYLCIGTPSERSAGLCVCIDNLCTVHRTHNFYGRG
jgi:hypothetical protein